MTIKPVIESMPLYVSKEENRIERPHLQLNPATEMAEIVLVNEHSQGYTDPEVSAGRILDYPLAGADMYELTNFLAEARVMIEVTLLLTENVLETVDGKFVHVASTFFSKKYEDMLHDMVLKFRADRITNNEEYKVFTADDFATIVKDSGSQEVADHLAMSNHDLECAFDECIPDGGASERTYAPAIRETLHELVGEKA